MQGNASIVDRIYEASVLPELWTEVLGQLASFSGTAWSTLVAVSNGTPRWKTSSLEADDIVRAHFEHFSDNIRTTRLLAKVHAGFITDFDILTQAEIDAEPVYQEFLIPRGYGFGVGTNISQPTGDLILLHCENLFSSGAVPPEVVANLDTLRPHLARSTLISARLAFEQARTALETLSALGLPACAVRQSGEVIVANDDFERDPNVWQTRRGDRIGLLDRRADGQLYQALALIATGHGCARCRSRRRATGHLLFCMSSRSVAQRMICSRDHRRSSF